MIAIGGAASLTFCIYGGTNTGAMLRYSVPTQPHPDHRSSILASIVLPSIAVELLCNRIGSGFVCRSLLPLVYHNPQQNQQARPYVLVLLRLLEKNNKIHRLTKCLSLIQRTMTRPRRSVKALEPKTEQKTSDIGLG